MPVQEKGMASIFAKQKYSMLKKVHGRTFFSGILKELQARRSNSEPLSVIWKMGWVLGKGRNF